MAEWYFNVDMYSIFFIHSSVDRHLGCFYTLTTEKSSAMNIGLHVSFQTIFFFGYMPRSVTARSYGNIIFRFLKNLYSVLHIVAVTIYSPTV